MPAVKTGMMPPPMPGMPAPMQPMGGMPPGGMPNPQQLGQVGAPRLVRADCFRLCVCVFSA